jgi:hypothetical protein
MRLLYDDGLKMMMAPSLEEIAEKELKKRTTQYSKIVAGNKKNQQTQ